jgi:hypothetical protein
MTSLESILKNFYFEPMNENRYPKFGKAGRQDYQFICKRCNSISEPMKFEPDIKYRLASHLVNHCHPSYSSEQQPEQEQQ